MEYLLLVLEVISTNRFSAIFSGLNISSDVTDALTTSTDEKTRQPRCRTSIAVS